MSPSLHRALAVPALLLFAIGCADTPPPPSDPEAVWAEAAPWSYEGSTLLGDDWRFSEAAADSIPEGAVERIRTAAAAIDGELRMLAVTRHGCIDSAYSVPFLAAAAERIEGLEFAHVEPKLGRTLMDEHPTEDGRGATPTVLLLDEEGSIRGCWLERPAALQYWYLYNPEDLGRVEKFAVKTEWYQADRGAHALAELAQILESAAAGDVVCGLPFDSVSALPEAGWAAASG